MAQEAKLDKPVIIYPDYINSAKTVAQGRRIAADKACDWPRIDEMLDACQKGLNLPAMPEMKRYPRNWCILPGKEHSYGRIQVQLRKPDGSPMNPDVPDMKTLLVKLAEFVSKHPLRHKKPGAKADAGSSSSAAGSSKQTAKKSGKKKK